MTENLDKQEFNDLSQRNLFIFKDLFKFARDHTGLSFTIAYLTLILSSMTYLHVLYARFDISIIKFLSLEDILATPIKNPNIIFVFVAIISVLVLVELSSEWNARTRVKYAGIKVPLWVRIFRIAAWEAKSRKMNILLTVGTTFIFLAIYIIIYAEKEASQIEKGGGTSVEIILSDSEQSIERTFLGTTTQFIFTYDLVSKQADIYQVESIKMINPIVNNSSGNVKIDGKVKTDTSDKEVDEEKS